MTKVVTVGDRDLAVWPQGLQIQRWLEPAVKLVAFPDTAAYHPQLGATILGLEQDPTLAKHYDPGNIGSSKIFHLERWGCPAADLIHARARALFRKVLKCDDAVVDLGWSSIYRTGDYCLPHSHYRATASIVYFLDLGSETRRARESGQFCFGDPRLEVCCREEPKCMTTPCGPQVEAGTMIIFPGYLVHFVDVYRGRAPRITLSWNINKTEISGRPPH